MLNAPISSFPMRRVSARCARNWSATCLVAGLAACVSQKPFPLPAAEIAAHAGSRDGLDRRHQDPDPWKHNDLGRFKVMHRKLSNVDEKASRTFKWTDPAVCVEDIDSADYLPGALSHRYRYVILGVEHDCLQLAVEVSYADAGAPYRKGASHHLSIPLVDGAYHLYTPDSVEDALCFKITPNKPHPGLFQIRVEGTK